MIFVRFFLFMSDTVHDFLGRNCPHIAAAIAFYTLFAMFPLFLAIISILGYVLGPRPEEEQLEQAKNIAEVLPVSSEFVSREVQGVVSARAITGIASIFGLLWASTAVFGAIRKGINAAWGIKKTRPFLKERLIDFALVLGAGVVLLAALFSAPGLSILKEVTSALAPDSQFFNNIVWNLMSSLLFPVLSFMTFLILYRYLPNTEVHYGVVWPGALLASLAFDGANLGFVWYVQKFPVAYNVIYGSVGTVLALLTWAYVSAIIVLFGAMVTSRYAAYVASLESEKRSLKLLWTGFSRVRLRVVEYSRTG
jgi:membrane protein